MNFVAKALVIVASLFLFSCKEKVFTPQSERTVSVQGRGEVLLEPDSVSIIFSVSSESWDVNVATKDAATRMTAVQAALKDNGIEEKYISIFDYSIHQEYDYTVDKRRYRNYIVNNKIRVQINDITAAGNIIDVAIKAGANELSDLTYNINNDQEAVKQARLLAIKQAEDTAQMLAGATGAQLGKILTIREYSNNQPYIETKRTVAASLASANDSTPLATGTKTVSVSVEAVWELQ